MVFLGLRMLIFCWSLPMTSLSRRRTFRWIRLQPKLFFLLGRPLGGRFSPWIGFKNGGDNSLIAVPWVFPETVKEVVFSWKGPFVGKKGKRFRIPSRCVFF